MSKDELLKYLIAEIDLIMHDKDYRFQNEDGTWYSRESCKDLTNEEMFEELKTELRQLANLETQLSLTEKALELACDRLKNLYCSDYCGRSCEFFCQTEKELKDECKLYYECWNKECVLEQAKEMMKSEIK